jgi:glycosyltransferase involved in cell wall biosynthesis
MKKRDIHTFVFSYNRGRFLRHCLETIKACGPGGKIIVIDDNSADPQTRSVLADVEQTDEVIRPPELLRTGAKTGGLYNNMNASFDLCRERGYERVIFIQDDMQFVRRLLPEDIERLDASFAANVNCVQIQTCFFRRSALSRMNGAFLLDGSGHSLLQRPGVVTLRGNFSAIGVFDVRRVIDLLGRLETGEVANSEKARARGLVLPRYVHPFMNWLPYPESYRGRKRAFAHFIIEYMAGNGFHPIDMMTEAEASAFTSRAPDAFPVAEQYLRSPTAPRQDIWATTGGRPSLVARGGWRAGALRLATRSDRLVRKLTRRRPAATWQD